MFQFQKHDGMINGIKCFAEVQPLCIWYHHRPTVYVTDSQVHGDVHSGAVAAVVYPQVRTGSVDANQPDGILASHIKTKASWPNI